MDYAFRLHVLKNLDLPAGHIYVEIKSPTGSTFYELNSNREFVGPPTLLLTENPWTGTAPVTPQNSHGRVSKTQDPLEFLPDLAGNKHIASQYVAITEQQYLQMQTYGDQRVSLNGGYVDYVLTRNSCVTFADAMVHAGGIQTPIANLFTAQDIVLTGDTWVWYSAPLAAVPRPGTPTPLDFITKFAAEVGF